MKPKVRTYETAEIAVEYDATRCIHVGECVGGLPRVFDPPAVLGSKRVWDLPRPLPTSSAGARRARFVTVPAMASQNNLAMRTESKSPPTVRYS